MFYSNSVGKLTSSWSWTKYSHYEEEENGRHGDSSGSHLVEHAENVLNSPPVLARACIYIPVVLVVSFVIGGSQIEDRKFTIASLQANPKIKLQTMN